MSFAGTFRPGHRISSPPPHTLGPDEVPDACRSAVLGLLRGAQQGWGKRKLAHWLMRAYGGVAMMAPLDDQPAPSTTRVGADQLYELLERTREEVIDVMLSLGDEARAQAFILDAMLSGWLAEALDANDTAFYIPLDRPGMPLLDRVLSLVAADYLARPTDYRDLLGLCNRCDCLYFDRRVRQRHTCRACGRRTTARRLASRIPRPSRDDFAIPQEPPGSSRGQ